MDDLESKLNAVLENPQMMQTIASLAQSLGQNEPAATADIPPMDMQLLQKLSGLAGQAGIDPNQKNLLAALGPYLNHSRISRLEKAMRAAKMARLASTFIGR